MTLDHECPRCHKSYPDFDVVLDCMAEHEDRRREADPIITDRELGEHFALALHEIFVAQMLNDGAAVRWTQTWAETMPKDRAKWRRN